MQTAIVITLEDGSQILVRAFGQHIDPQTIAVDRRGDGWSRWMPTQSYEVRRENG